MLDNLKEKMDAYLDPFGGDGILHNRDNMDENNETEYKCSECGADWEGESCFGYVNPVCAKCGTVAPQAKVEK